VVRTSPATVKSTTITFNCEMDSARHFVNDLEPAGLDDDSLKHIRTTLQEAIYKGLKLIQRATPKRASSDDSVYTGTTGSNSNQCNHVL
jgi:hypothetical protein